MGEARPCKLLSHDRAATICLFLFGRGVNVNRLGCQLRWLPLDRGGGRDESVVGGGASVFVTAVQVAGEQRDLDWICSIRATSIKGCFRVRCRVLIGSRSGYSVLQGKLALLPQPEQLVCFVAYLSFRPKGIVPTFV